MNLSIPSRKSFHLVLRSVCGNFGFRSLISMKIYLFPNGRDMVYINSKNTDELGTLSYLTSLKKTKTYGHINFINQTWGFNKGSDSKITMDPYTYMVTLNLLTFLIILTSTQTQILTAKHHTKRRSSNF